ncbi:CDP-alcohol phosphatidyltransferase family protein [Lichenifustis flavocetrariae]|uniref:Phosphatidylcholine/phosphatidylserine synthase n=1 Tax=Lichenifustis flavocetrariae TaxID=2949735 RepID=A0AA41Z768_9HYPH|nr:phosphatidylcholine/phosphatidylserine synthase [Lichenifustis flavocetrariae]MCW6510512.1 phosphatidylcholine/phosphatidylserine synthase [Lichenifustis flavocetrariae]
MTDSELDDDLQDLPPRLETLPRQRRFRKVPVRYILPNLITLVALCLGLTAIRFAVEGRFELAVLTILAAAVFDGLDGRIARALQGTTKFGAELDSLADFVDFGVAPALTLYLWSLSSIKSFGWFAALVFAVACALRLARFNVALEDPDKPAWTSHFFTGMPAPAGAVVAMLPLYLHFSVLDLQNSRAWVVAQIVYLLIVAGLMASRIPHFSAKNLGRVPRENVIVVLFGVATALLLLATFTMEMLAVMTVFYLCFIPFSIRRFRLYLQEDERSHAAAAELNSA